MGKCKDCEYWKPTEGTLGICKRYAPSPTIVEVKEGLKYQLCWPSTALEDECGEFVGKSNA